MPDVATDGRTKVWSVPSIANIAAPTVAELNAGTALEARITPDGLMGFEPDTSAIDTSALNSTKNLKTPGRVNLDNTGLRMKKQSGTDTVYNTMIYGYATNIVIRRDTLSSTAWTVADKVEVYPVTCGEVKNLTPEANSLHKYEVPTMVTGDWNQYATVA
jgi:hypothetical protein